MGGNRLITKKRSNFPSPPFFGLWLTFDNDKEYRVQLDNNKYCTTFIDYNMEEEQFDVYVRNHWQDAVSDETVDSVFEESKRGKKSTILILKI
jgi:hypothetical protein